MKNLIRAVTVLAVSTAQADTLYVDVDCPGPGNASEAEPYCSIQSAIEIAVDTDAIAVARGPSWADRASSASTLMPGSGSRASPILAAAVSASPRPASYAAPAKMNSALEAGSIISTQFQSSAKTVPRGFFNLMRSSSEGRTSPSSVLPFLKITWRYSPVSDDGSRTRNESNTADGRCATSVFGSCPASAAGLAKRRRA